MKFNYTYENKKFIEKQKKQAEEYRKQGVSEDDIKAMYEFDREQFNSERRYREHTQPLVSVDIYNDESKVSKSDLLSDIMSEMAVSQEETGSPSRYWWIETINNDRLAEALKALSVTDKEILTLYFVEGYVQSEIGERLGTTQKQISRSLKRIIKSLTNCLKRGV